MFTTPSRTATKSNIRTALASRRPITHIHQFTTLNDLKIALPSRHDPLANHDLTPHHTRYAVQIVFLSGIHVALFPTRQSSSS